MKLSAVSTKARTLSAKAEDFQYMLENALDRKTIDWSTSASEDVWRKLVGLVEESVILLGQVDELATLHDRQ